MLINFLMANRDIFAWKPADIPVVPKELIEHCLKVDPKATPKKQLLRRFSPNKREAIKKELAKLLAAGFIKEVYRPEWLANPVPILEKNNNEWRMCVWIILISTDTARKILLRSHASTKSSTQWLAAFCFPSLTATRANIRLPSRKKTRSRNCSSPHLEHTPTKPYPLG
jgi:hypothetical protein